MLSRTRCPWSHRAVLSLCLFSLTPPSFSFSLCFSLSLSLLFLSFSRVYMYFSPSASLPLFFLSFICLFLFTMSLILISLPLWKFLLEYHYRWRNIHKRISKLSINFVQLTVFLPREDNCFVDLFGWWEWRHFSTNTEEQRQFEQRFARRLHQVGKGNRTKLRRDFKIIQHRALLQNFSAKRCVFCGKF